MTDTTAPGTKPEDHVPLIVIDTVEGYRAAVAEIAAGTGPIAIDAERASGFRYSQRAYLIQVFRRGAGVYLFDPPAIGDFRELQDAIADEEWVLHAASQDLACLREVGLDPARIFDTELGARLAGLPRVGLGTVVEQLLGIHLAKEHSAADWSTRPLPQSWLVYAALDVELLPDLRDAVHDLLESAGKLEFAEQEFQATLAKETPVRVDPWRRLSGIHGVRSPRALAVAKALWEARDAYAQEVDTAPGRLVPDGSLVAAAKALPPTKRDLAGMKEFVGRASRSQLDRWFGAIEAGLAAEETPPVRAPGDAGPPPPRIWSDRDPEADKRLKTARAAITAISEHVSIPVENLLTPELLRRVAWTPPAQVDRESIGAALAELGARPWQIDATAQVIADAFVEAAQSAADGSADAS
ncbi:HRDC domain-containing protein [Schumannella sp. 10F1B-5-1]|uniref:HRDC domain-containing protein n=1 Tax=Schumannella sp. 10F1B-5-1 TaxID=2590780 RepID=UPI001130CD33|nr:HRDC domain-containing protein [Schumannella sp. 10F1B-5-1]TPW70885.1 ribonuclease D [Schumannella sp. 10F1B-5-1]